MADPEEGTFESRFLQRDHSVRDAVTSDTDFQRWKSHLGQVTIDGEHLYVRGGDMLRDEDQVVFEWAWEHGLISQQDLDRENS